MKHCSNDKDEIEGEDLAEEIRDLYKTAIQECRLEAIAITSVVDQLAGRIYNTLTFE